MSPSFRGQFVIRVDGCCANCVVVLAFLPSRHMTRKQRHYDVRTDAITTSCPLGWLVRLAGLPGVVCLWASLPPQQWGRCWWVPDWGSCRRRSWLTRFPRFTHFYPRPVLAFGYCRCPCPSVRPSVRHQVCPRDNSSPVQATITKFRPKGAIHLG